MPHRSSCSHYAIYPGVICDKQPLVTALRQCLESSGEFVIVDVRQQDNSSFDDFVDISDIDTHKLNSSVVGNVNYMRVQSEGIEYGIQDIHEQLSWANHAGMYAVMLSNDQLIPITTLSSLISGFVKEYPPESSVTRVWVRLKPTEWTDWDTIRTITNYPYKLSVCLDVSEVTTESFDRWLGEPVAAFILPDSLSIPDDLLLKLVQRNAQPISKSPNQIESLLHAINRLPKLKIHEEYIAPYHDSLQLPLQPLADEMGNAVYETFEHDRKKYDLYEEAVFRALTDMLNDDRSRPVILAVVGAGRGGLVDAILLAISRLELDGKEKFSIACIEKNKNAFRTLQFRLNKDPRWTGTSCVSITLVSGDMRKWEPTHPIDILVSELLGSLGDNEASPECLDSVVHHLEPSRGISIPHNYYSAIEPMSAHKLWMHAREMGKLETVLVAQLHTIFFPTKNVLTMFAFDHQRVSDTSSLFGETRNNRSITLSWTMEVDCTIHGFAGYFHCDLYGGVTMSTNPPTVTEEMVSWFPAFLPISTPLRLVQGQTITIQVERKCTDEKIWIEWTVIEPIPQPTNNPGGSVYSVRLL